jgi:glucose-6-phosphate isomerase
MATTATAAQAWAILARHARDEIAPLRLQELCRDNARVSSLVPVHNSSDHMLLADLSRQRMTLETIHHLLKLASATKLKSFITKLAWGQNDPQRPILPGRQQQQQQTPSSSRKGNSTRFEQPGTPSFDNSSSPTTASMHMALRVPAHKNYQMLTQDGTNALTEIHQEWDRLEQKSDSIRNGQLRGVSGALFCDIVVVGQGLPIQALQFVYNALLRDERAATAQRLDEAMAARIIRRTWTGGAALRRCRFVTRVDPVAVAAVVADLDPASTLVISLALNGNEETGLATKTLKSWLLQAGRPDQVLAKHMMLVTGNDRIASVINKPESVHMIPEHSRCEAFCTFSAATLLVGTGGLYL